MTDAALLALALRPRISPPPSHISWEKQCKLCPQTFCDQCMMLNLAGLPIRCQGVSDEEHAKLEEALRWQG